MWRLPDRWGRFEGIEGLPVAIVGSQALVYVFNFTGGNLASLLHLTPAAFYGAQPWRLITFLFVPPETNFFWLCMWLYVTYIYADALETAWGSFRFTLFYAVGALATMAVALWPWAGYVPNGFLNTSLFLAFATLFPETELLLFFILPVKVKYLGYIAWFGLAFGLWAGSATTRLAILASLVNFILLLGPDIFDKIRLALEVRRNRRRWRGGE